MAAVKEEEKEKEERDKMARRTHLLNIEKNIQNIWKEHGIYEKDIVDVSDKKFMGNFPYPYMNGYLHVGHAFTLSKLDFLTRFKNMVCDNALLPFAFHCTGTPIVVCADKLRNELRLKENSIHDLEKKEKQNDAEAVDLSDGKREALDEQDKSEHKATDTTVFRSHKSKAQAKGGKQNSQLEIMKQMDIPETDIHFFQNPEYWCHYFSDKAQEHLNSLGIGCDWRRAFITTNINPYYDKFVKWQFNKLYEKNLIYYGTRITIFSKVNNQACADHERSEGEGVKCQEYTLLKIYINDNKQFFDIFMKHKEFQVKLEKNEEHLQNEIFSESFFHNKKIALLGGTLKPETAYGQNYTFVNPNEYYYLTFGFSKQVLNFGTKNYVNNIMTKEQIMKNCEYIYICSENSLYNLAYQGIIPMLKVEDELITNSTVNGAKSTSTNNGKGAKANDLSDLFILNKLKGEHLIGLKTHTNLSKIKDMYILPMTSIKMNVSTAVVPCVSSDSADDYACLEELRRKKNYYCEKYNLKEENLNSVSFSCIELPDIGTHTGKYFCEQEKITSYKDAKLLKIKDILYKRQFFEGTMTVEEYLGMKTAKCRKLVKQYILKNNEGFLYNEPESLVMDRNNVKCIAALCNQWYINYGNVEFKRDVLIQLKKHNFQTYSDVLYKQLQHVIFWLDDWSCSRAYGLGTEVPRFRKREQEMEEMEPKTKVETNTELQGMSTKEKEEKEKEVEDESEQNEDMKMTDKKEGVEEKELIESLSDSTIYMAYYTISHFLQGNVAGSKKGLLNIAAKDINDEFFDYVFDISDDMSKINKNISKEKLEEMRKEFQFWYPFDVRISGKDLIFNHLTMTLFNHVAIWGKKVYNKNKDSDDEKNGMDLLERQTEILNEIENLNLDEYETIKYFPKSFFCNGHVLINKEKMSKSKGNFITLQKCITLYSSDGTRVALADAGDTIEDANFNTDTANSAIMKLYNLINFCIETKNNVYIFRCGEKTFNDLIFENEINYLTNKCKDAYEKLQFRDVLKYGFYDMLLKRDIYRQMCDKINMHKDVINFFIERICLIINPIIPHVTEHIWTYILKKEKFLMKQKWPATEHTKFSIVMHKQYINLLNVVENFRKSYDRVMNKMGKSKKGGANTPGEKEKKQQIKKNNSNTTSSINNNNKETTNEEEKEDEGKVEMTGSKDKLQNNVEDEEEEETNYKAVVYVATEYNSTQKKVIEILNNIINNSEDKKLPPNFISLLVENEYIKTLPKNEKKDILGFATFLVKDNVTLNNNQYELTLPYDEIQLIKKNVDFIKRSLNLSDIQVFQNTKKYEIDNTDIATFANPGNPSIFIHKSDT